MCIELDQFQADRGERTDALEFVDPGQHIGEPTLERRWKPSGTPLAIVEPRGSVACFSVTPASSESSSRVKRRLDLVPSMGQFSSEDDSGISLVDNGYTRCFASRINLDSVVCYPRVSFGCFQDDGKGVSFEHGGLPLIQQETGPCRMNRIKRVFVGV